MDRLEETEVERALHQARKLLLYPDDDGSWVIRGRLDPEAGAVLMRALEAAADALYREMDRATTSPGQRPVDPPAPLERPASPEHPAPLDPPAPLERPSALQRRADALGLIAESVLRYGLAGEALERVAGGDAVGRAAPPAAATGQTTSAEAENSEGVGTDARVADDDAAGRTASPAANGRPAERNGMRPRPINRSDRYQVVVHVDAAALSEDSYVLREDPAALREGSAALHKESTAPREASSSGQAVLADGVGVSGETSRRLACDGSRVVMVHDAEGNVLDVGRRRRTVPPAIRRALEHRDGGCRFPGCGSRWVEAHHLKHWADGGETRLANLTSLCRFHHRAVHEEGFTVRVDEAGEARFFQPDGRLVPEVPAPPRVDGDAVENLKRANDELGLELGPSTATPPWTGERLDLDWTLMTLRASPS